MFTFLVVIHVITCTVLVITVLLQQGKGAEIGAVFGSSEAIFGSTGPATLLSKVTTVSAVVFMLTSLSLTYLSIHSRGESVMRRVQQAPVVPAQLPAMPGKAPAAEKERKADPQSSRSVKPDNSNAVPAQGTAGHTVAQPVKAVQPSAAGAASENREEKTGPSRPAKDSAEKDKR